MAVHNRRAPLPTGASRTVPTSGPTLELSSTLAELWRMKQNDRLINFLPWALRVPEPKTGTLDFDRFPFQRELYDAGAGDKEAVIEKASQVGISTFALRWAMYWADQRGMTGLYLFPKRQQMYDFCLAGDERVLMADGTLREMRDVSVGDRVLSSDGQQVCEDVVTAAWCSGVRPLVTVAMAGGRAIRCTREHRIFTRRGWLRAGHLKVGDEVCVPRTLPPAAGEYLDPDDAFLLALWLAEGSKTRPGYTVTCGDPLVRERARRIAAERGWDVYEAGCFHLALTAKWRKSDDTPAALLRRYGVRGMRTHDCGIPDVVMRADRAAQEEFFRTYLACDGSVARREVTVASASERMVRDLQVLAARLGMPGTVRSRQPSYPGSLRAWTFAVAEAPARAQALALGAYAKATAAGELAEVEPALGWASVRSVTPDATEETFDLETAEHHAFFLEGGLTHNSDARVKPVIERSEYLSGRVPQGYTQNKGLKQIGLGLVYFRGSESRDDLLSIDADHLVMDEYNDLKEANIPDAEKRVGASPHALIRRLGVPTYPDYGISALYDASDQRLWMTKCAGCGDWQTPDFFANVDEATAALLCERCRKPLDVTAGEWVPRHPDRDVRGYRVSRLLLAGADIAGMVRRSKAKRPLDIQNFYNHDLGLPYAAAEGRLTDAALLAAQSAGGGYTTAEHPGYSGGQLVTMGIDVANVRSLNVRISLHVNDREKIALFLGEVESFNDLEPLMDRYGVRMAVIDAAPEYRLAMAFAERFPGRVYLLRQATKTQPQVVVVKEDMREVHVRRIEMLDATLELIRSQRNRLPADWPADYPTHMKALQRVVTKDDLGVPKVSYIVTGNTDADWAFAEAHDVVALELWWYRQAVDEAQRETFTRLEDRLEFERADLSSVDGSPGGYYEGPMEDMSGFYSDGDNESW